MHTYIKDSGPRNKSNMNLAELNANEAKEIVFHLIPLESPTFHIAKALLSLGEVLLEKKEYEEG
jgi:hypothetical protein